MILYPPRDMWVLKHIQKMIRNQNNKFVVREWHAVYCKQNNWNWQTIVLTHRLIIDADSWSLVFKTIGFISSTIDYRIEHLKKCRSCWKTSAFPSDITKTYRILQVKHGKFGPLRCWKISSAHPWLTRRAFRRWRLDVLGMAMSTQK